MPAMETTLIIVKPDGVQRGLVGCILQRFEQKGLQIAGMKLLKMSKELAEDHYCVHRERGFYDSLIRFITASPVVVIALRGVNAVAITRKMVGATFGPDAEAGTIRGDFGISKAFNLVHGSDSTETAKEELARFFTAEELPAYELISKPWLYDEEDLA